MNREHQECSTLCHAFALLSPGENARVDLIHVGSPISFLEPGKAVECVCVCEILVSYRAY